MVWHPALGTTRHHIVHIFRLRIPQSFVDGLPPPLRPTLRKRVAYHQYHLPLLVTVVEGVSRSESICTAEKRSCFHSVLAVGCCFLCIRQSSVWPHLGSGIMATLWSITVVHLVLSGALHKTISQIPNSGACNHQGMPYWPRIPMRC